MLTFRLDMAAGVDEFRTGEGAQTCQFPRCCCLVVAAHTRGGLLYGSGAAIVYSVAFLLMGNNSDL